MGTLAPVQQMFPDLYFSNTVRDHHVQYQIAFHLREHPELLGELAKLCSLRHVPAPEQNMLGGLAIAHARTFHEGVAGRSVSQVQAGIGLVGAINARLAGGGVLTAAERHYMAAWFDHASLAVLDMPAAVGDRGAVGTVADGLLNLTHTERGGVPWSHAGDGLSPALVLRILEGPGTEGYLAEYRRLAVLLAASTVPPDAQTAALLRGSARRVRYEYPDAADLAAAVDMVLAVAARNSGQQNP